MRPKPSCGVEEPPDGESVAGSTIEEEHGVDATEPKERTGVFTSMVPARLDRLPWTGFHTLVLVALGFTWILNGLEVQLASQGGVVLQDGATLGLSTAQVGALASMYALGTVMGALGFGRLTDTLGRRRLFFVTLGVFMVGNVAAALSQEYWMLLVFRFVAGVGAGGENVAIISMIDEVIPARHRARANIAIGATFWTGTMLGAALGLVLLDPARFPVDLGWRLALCVGPLLSVFVLFLRRNVPESPRWLMTHGRGEEAERVVDGIEERARRGGHDLSPVPADKGIEIRRDPVRAGYVGLARVLFVRYPGRTLAAFAMLATQAFLYASIFFSFALVLSNFYGVAPNVLSYYIFLFGAGNVLTVLFAPLFDTIGRRKMVLFSYCGSGAVLALTGYLFYLDVLSALTLTLLWCLTFFIVGAGAAAAYLVASEVWPVELRAEAFSMFYVVASTFGAVGPTVFGALIGDGTDRFPLMVGYLVGAGMVVVGGLVMWFFGVDAERRSLEDIAPPLSATGEKPNVTPGMHP